MKKLFFIFIATAMFSSCTPMIMSFKYSESSARNLESAHTMLTTPLIADLDVQKTKIKHVERDAFRDIVVDYSIVDNISELKKIALARAAEVNNADVLVGTTIKVETINDQLVITVTGYPARYKNFRNATVKDAELVSNTQAFSYDNTQVLDAPDNTSTK